MSAPRCERVIGVAAAESVGRGGGKRRVLLRPNGALALGMRVRGREETPQQRCFYVGGDGGKALRPTQ